MDPINSPVILNTTAPEDIGPDEEIQLDQETVVLVDEYLKELSATVQPIIEDDPPGSGCPPCPRS